MVTRAFRCSLNRRGATLDLANHVVEDAQVLRILYNMEKLFPYPRAEVTE